MHSEEELIKGCTKGDRAIQKALFDRYCPKMRVICQRYAKTTLEADDILQEGFIKVFANIGNFRHQSSLATWITRIMINTALNFHRQKLYLHPMVEVEKANLSEAEEVSLSAFHLQELVAMIQALPDGCRIIFNLFAIEGYTHREIAEELSISEGTSKSQYNRAKSLLKEKITNEQKRYGRLGERKV